MISLTTVVFADLRYLQSSYIKLQTGLNMLAGKWIRNIDPPVIESLIGYYPAISCRISPLKN